ncbi:MAG: hypothetical protein M3Y03_06010 [Verrucomicrobiota bacterium]|nr:hypothetical protein [Verrucomicrobiota bacterium]
MSLQTLPSPVLPFHSRPTKFHVARVPQKQRSAGSVEATAEISAYIALREMYLSEAEAGLTETALARAERANEFVVDTLRPARSPYEAQHLAENDAVRERQRCAAVSLRLLALRNRLDSNLAAA